MDKFQEIKDKLEEISLLVDSLDKQKDNSAEWSEEDEKYIKLIKKGIRTFYQPYKEDEIYDWLDSLKDKYSTQPLQRWSKEDKMRIHEIIETLNIVQENRLCTQRTHYSKATIDNDIEWLKSLKDRVQPQQQELSEDTQQWIDAIIKDYEGQYDADKDHRATIQAKIDTLKSLRPQQQWKPTQE